MENSMIHSAIMRSRQPLNIFTVFNGLHMAKNNISLAWSTLHFHPKQIHRVNWVSKMSPTKTRAHRNWKKTKKLNKTWGSLCWFLSMSYTCLFVFKQMFVHRQYLEFLLGSIMLQHAGGNTMQVHNGWFIGFVSIKRGTDKCRRQTRSLFYLMACF